MVAFPEEIPERLITLYSYVEETVLDPFLGTGTTCTVARRLYRNLDFNMNCCSESHFYLTAQYLSLWW